MIQTERKQVRLYVALVSRCQPLPLRYSTKEGSGKSPYKQSSSRMSGYPVIPLIALEN